MKSLDTLVTRARDISMNAFLSYLKTHDVDASTLNIFAVSAAMKKAVKARIHGAMDDARDALDANMGEQIAMATFGASMKLAGIEAAKQFV